MSYACRSLQPGQRVIAFTMQPELRSPVLSWLGHTMAMRKVDLAHLVILTDSELIVIRDDPSSPASCDDTHYGGVWDYLPSAGSAKPAWTSAPPARPCSCACPATSASKCSSPAAAKRSACALTSRPPPGSLRA